MSSLLTARTLNGRSPAGVVAAGAAITSIGLGAHWSLGRFLDPVTTSLDIGYGLTLLVMTTALVTSCVRGRAIDQYSEAEPSIPAVPSLLERRRAVRATAFIYESHQNK